MEENTTWPTLHYPQFKSTGYLLHMAMQALGKFTLHCPFDPHWANVVLLLTPRGLSTGLIPYSSGSFGFDVDMITHKISVNTSWGLTDSFDISSMSVAQLTNQIFLMLKNCKIELTINTLPQEIPDPIPFEKDTEQRTYDKTLANTWWKILLNVYWVMKKYHSRFDGESPPIGLMWGSFDLRDARYNGKKVETTGMNSGFIRRNAMDEGQSEIGFWPGNEMYPKPAFFSFIHPEPKGIQQAKIKPAAAHWDATLMEFILDYEDLIKSHQPAKDLLEFFESTYKAGTEIAGWDVNLITKGEPT